MTGQWYYGRGSDISGPVSGGQLAEMAASGTVVPTDMLWREGDEVGISAGTISNLFPAPALGSTASPPAVSEPELGGTPRAAGDAPDVPAGGESPPVGVAPDPAVVQRSAPARAARAMAGKGTVIVGQDGKNVKFRMRCLACGKEDSSWKSLPIPRGTARASFFCPKCRKRQDVEIHGVH